MLLSPHSKLVMIGDSITDCGRAQPVGEGLFGALGNGYVSLVDGFLNAVYPDLHIRTVNMGKGGNTVRDLAKRWQTDVIDLAPDALTIMIGINDVWRQFDLPTQKETHVPPDEYRETLTRLVQEANRTTGQIFLATPFYIESNKADAMRARMDKYGEIVKAIATETHCHLIDTQAAIDSLLERKYPAELAWDRVHPTVTGHVAIAKAFVDAFGFSWNR